MLHPSTVHLCISRRWTAEKCIFSAPLSQNVFKHTLHCTLFLPVAGLMNCVPRFRGSPGEPHCRFVGVSGLRQDMLLGCLTDLAVSLSRLRFNALWVSSSSSSDPTSLFASPLTGSPDRGDFLAVDKPVDIRLGNVEATKLAAANELAAMAAAEWLKDVDSELGGGGGGHIANEVDMLRFKPAGDSLSDDLRLTDASEIPTPSFLKSNGCMLWRRFNGDEFIMLLYVILEGVEDISGSPRDPIFRKLKGCFWCGDMVGNQEGWKAEGEKVGGDGRRFGDIAWRELCCWRCSSRSRVGS